MRELVQQVSEELSEKKLEKDIRKTREELKTQLRTHEVNRGGGLEKQCIDDMAKDDAPSLPGSEDPTLEKHLEQLRRKQDVKAVQGMAEGLKHTPRENDKELLPQVNIQAKRFNTGKPKLSYFRRSFPRALEVIARIKEFGAAKYDDGNWRLGGKPDEEYLDSMDRHIDAWLAGEDYDPDSGCHHIGHAIWNLCALLELNISGPVIDEDHFKERVEFWLKKKNG